LTSSANENPSSALIICSIWKTNFGIITDRLRYKTNPNIPKIISVEVNRLKPLPSRRETNGAKIKASRIDKARITIISVSK
jgi:hypothetical protein